MDVRVNHKTLTPAAKTTLVKAILGLKNDVDSVLHPGKQQRYDDFVEVHKNSMMMGIPAHFHPMPHGSALFFPWHRVLLRQFELALQKVAKKKITLPYWDWSLAGTSTPFTEDFLGGDGDAAQGGRVTTGPFAASTGKFPIRVWDHSTGDGALHREFGDDATSFLPTPSQIAADLAKVPYWPGPSCFEVIAETMLHNPVHRWVGGNMAFATSPNDPVFFLHHAFLDKLWEDWKTQHPTVDPYLPTSDSHGHGLDDTLVFNNATHLAPWAGSWTVKQTLDPSALGYEYV
jgi:tyrosinase